MCISDRSDYLCLSALFFATCLILLGGSPARAADPLPPGHAEFASGTQVVLSLPSGDAMKEVLLKMFSGPKMKPKEMLKKFGEQAARTTWRIRVLLVNGTPKEKHQDICDDQIRYRIIPSVPNIPKRYEQIEIQLFDLEENQLGDCVYRLDRPGIVSEATDKAIVPYFGATEFELPGVGKVRAAPLMRVNRIDMANEVSDFLIIFLSTMRNDTAFASYIDASARYLYDRSPENVSIAITVAFAEKIDGQFNASGMRVMTKKLDDGSIVQFSQIKLHTGGWQVEGKPKAKKQIYVIVQANNENLTHHIREDTAKDYYKDGLYTDSRRIFDAVGAYAADVFSVDKAIVVSVASAGKKGMRMSVPVIFERVSGKWNIRKTPEK